MKKLTIAAVMSLSLVSACAEFPIGSADPGSLGSANSASSAGDNGWLWAVLGAAAVYLVVNNGDNN